MLPSTRLQATLLEEFTVFLEAKSTATIDAYRRAVRQALEWLREHPGHEEGFHPDQLTRTAVESYLGRLERQGTSASHQARVKAALSAFATFLMEEKGWLRRNPTRGIVLPAQALLAPRLLAPEQRYALRSLVEREGSARSAALFALGYWAGCRVSDVSWLRVRDTHLTRKAGWVRVGYKNGKMREIDLLNEARRAVAQYLAAEGDQAQAATTETEREFVFASQRQDRLTEAGIHH
jgi:site-specific recombinase XerD